MPQIHKPIGIIAVAVAAFLTCNAAPASASLIFDASIIVSGAGFGSIPRDLTIQQPNDPGIESGCVGIDGGGLFFGATACISDASVFDGNGVTNTGGSEVSPLGDNNKYGAPSFGDLGITDASQLQIIFNATDPGCGATDVKDLTVKFYNGTTVIGAIDGSHTFTGTECGNGTAGFAFVVTPDEYAFVNSMIAFGPDVRMALESTVHNATNGPDSFFARSSDGTTRPPIPEPTSLLLLGTGLFGSAAAAVRRRQAKKQK